MMHNSSKDMIFFVGSIGEKIVSATKAYMKKVDPDLPNPKQLKLWIKTHRELCRRYSQKDFRHTSQEFGQMAELAQYLVNLHAAAHKTPAKQLTIVEENMIVRERIMG